MTMVESRQLLDHKNRVFTVFCTGDIGRERALRALPSIRRQAAEMGYALLFDLREARIHLSFADATSLLEASRDPWGWEHRVALVGKEEPELSWLRFVAGTAVNAGVVARMFHAPEEAHAWAAAAVQDVLVEVEREGVSILVVDDDPGVLEVTSTVLRDSGFQVLEAATGEAGLEVARTRRPALVLLDVVLPGLDGREVCRLIKGNPGLEGTLVALVSGARTEIEDQAGGLAAGADGYIPRPVGNRELLARVEILLWRREVDRRAGQGG